MTPRTLTFSPAVRTAARRLPALLLLAALLVALGGCNAPENEHDSEGAAFLPRDLGDAPVNNAPGSVGATDPSYYSVKIDGATDYTVSLTMLDDDADLFVYSLPDYETLSCASANEGAKDESCVYLQTGATIIFIKVKPHSLRGSAYFISIK